MFYAGICQFTTSQQENHTGFAPPAPRLRAAPAPLVLFRPSGAVGFHRPKQMPRLVSLRHSGSPAVCLRGSASPGGLATQLGEPARFAYGFALVSPRTLRSRLRRLLAALGALPPHSDFRLARRRSPRRAANPQSGFAFNVCSRTLIIDPDIPTKAGYIIVTARFIARTLLSRQGWKRLCGAGDADGFPPGGGDRRKPYVRAGADKRRRSPRKTTALPKPHLSGQPGRRGERSESRLVKALRCERM